MRTEPRPRSGPRGSRAEPLPRAPFGIADELSCYYDAPAEPCNVHLEVLVADRLDEAALRRAIRAALAEQPRALVRRARGGWWQRSYAWEVPGDPDIDPLSVTTWANEQDLGQRRMRFLAAAPSLDSSPPVRLLLAAGPGEDCLILNAHHAALDGISCLELLHGIARHYGTAADSAASHSAAGPGTEASAAEPGRPAVLAAAHPPARAALPARLSGPARLPLPPSLAPPSLVARSSVAPHLPPDSPFTVQAAPRPSGSLILRVLPRPAARIATEVTSGGDGYGFQLITWERVPRLPGTEPGPRVTVNDLLITALVVAIGRWNAAHGRSPGRIRITMPVNARAPGQAGAAGNLSRLTAVTAQPGRGGDVRPLAADVAAQTLAAKNNPGPQVDPLSRALAAAWCPAAVKHRLLRLALRTAGPLICDTSLVTNLGIVADPPRFGPAPVTGMWFSTSAHMPRGLSVGAITLAGRLHLCLRYRHALFSEPAAARFAVTYAAALSEITSQEVDSDRQH
jgi:NRPS condensation-like uncharacterized protein